MYGLCVFPSDQILTVAGIILYLVSYVCVLCVYRSAGWDKLLHGERTSDSGWGVDRGGVRGHL